MVAFLLMKFEKELKAKPKLKKIKIFFEHSTANKSTEGIKFWCKKYLKRIYYVMAYAAYDMQENKIYHAPKF